jgi:hypothetical protein
VNQSRFSDSSLSGDQDTGTVRVRNGIGYELLLLRSPTIGLRSMDRSLADLIAEFST